MISFFTSPNFRIYKAIASLLLLLLFVVNLYAQKSEINFDKLTVEAGLSQSSVLSIAQDDEGFLWFGTRDGLNRYDGQKFEIFKYDSKDSKSLSSSQNVNTLLVDKKGNLWIATQQGLNLYEPSKQSFKRFVHQSNDKNSLSNNTIRCIYEDLDSNIWIGTENGLNKLKSNGGFEHFLTGKLLEKGRVNPIIKAIFQDSKRNIWIGTQAGLIRLTNINGKYKTKLFLHNDNDPSSISSNYITTITEDLNHNLWIGSHVKGLNLFDRNTDTFKHFNTSNSGISSNIIRKIIVDRKGLLWIATLNGISIYDPIKQQFNNQYHNPENALSLNQNSIYDIFQDKDGSMWVGTYYGGINVYHPNAVPFKVYKHYSYRNSLSSNIVSALVQDKNGNLWIGTEAEGLDYFDKKTGLFKNFRSTDKGNSLSSNLIKAISIDADDNLWIAAYEGGVDYYNTKTQIFKHYKISDINSLNESRFSYLITNYQNKLWVGTKKGLYLFNKAKEEFEPLQNKTSNFYLPAQNINYLYEDSFKTLWVSTELGVYYLPKGQRHFIKLSIKGSKFLNHINTIAQTKNGVILLGSHNEGLAFYYSNKKKLRFFTVQDGLPSDNITGIIQDNQNRIWISTNKGIAQLNQNHIRIFDRNDGLPGIVFNNHSVLKDKNGWLYFGGYNGLVSFNPEDLSTNNVAPKVVFTHLRLFDKEIKVDDNTGLLSKSLKETDKLVLPYHQNVVSLDFSVLNFVKSKKNRYAYKLEGLQDTWSYLNNPTITLNNLPDGSYNLLVKGSNNDGVWSEPVSLKIIIRPPFWKTWWAYTLYLMVIIGIFYLLMRFLLMKALLKREQEVHEMKLEFFTNVSHEIRTPLTLILGPLERMIQETVNDFSLHKQLLTVNKNAKRLMKLINELMDFRKIESGNMSLNVTKDNIVVFVKEIYFSFQQLAIQKAIEYKFITNDEDIEVYFDKDQLEKTIFNLLSNAFKFTPFNGIISLEILKEEDYVFIKVKDNGGGIPEESRQNIFKDFYQAGNHNQGNIGTGIGLALSKSIAKLHHGDLVLEDNNELTIFCLSLKQGYQHFVPKDIKESLNIEDSKWYSLQSEVDTLIYDDIKRQNSISDILPLVLVVDDNLEVKNFIVRTLMPYYQVITANDGAEALILASEKIPDVIISDVMMPKINGFELCNKIRNDIRTRHIPVVLLTARSSDLHELEGLKNGADIYLAKPFSTQKLQLIIKNLLNQQENMRMKFSKQFSLEPSMVLVESSDEEFLSKVLKLVEDNISNSEFGVNMFATKMGMSPPVLYKKINALTGMTVNNFIKSIRLKRALQLFQQNAGNISEIAYMVGFNDAKYFSKEFKKQFGKSISAYQK